MRKLILPALVACTLVGGCAQNGFGGLAGNPIGGILGSVLGGGLGTASSSSNEQFARAAVNACGQYASQYGQVRISDVDQVSRSTMRVEGRIANNYEQRAFACNFRSDGRITDFRVA